MFPSHVPVQRQRPIVEPMAAPTPNEPHPSDAQASNEDGLVDDDYAQLAAVFNTEEANAERRSARDTYVHRGTP